MSSSAPSIGQVLRDDDVVERDRRRIAATPKAVVREMAVVMLTASAVLLTPATAGAADHDPDPDPGNECTYDEGFWFWWLDLGQGHWECERS